MCLELSEDRLEDDIAAIRGRVSCVAVKGYCDDLAFTVDKVESHWRVLRRE